jgi:hypothetical protein
VRRRKPNGPHPVAQVEQRLEEIRVQRRQLARYEAIADTYAEQIQRAVRSAGAHAARGLPYSGQVIHETALRLQGDLDALRPKATELAAQITMETGLLSAEELEYL